MNYTSARTSLSNNQTAAQTQAVKKPESIIVCERTENIANHTHHLIEHLSKKLEPILSSEFPCDCNSIIVDYENTPTLFRDLHESLNSIASFICKLERLIERIEL